ncbi:MAG: flagellar assembly peptidoglycan hydrolase FlgJ [Betaproteobacteria bacterium]|nr:flagellar assembly peptidoglycan hydrolase FlgJ [Betaproteobacteria bacterium]
MSSPLNPAAAQAADSLSFQGLNQLQALAQSNPHDPATIRAVSRQFEALLVQELMKSANATKLGPDLLGDSGGPLFESLFTQQVADVVSQGSGIGLGSFLARELAARYGAAGKAGDGVAGSASAPASGTPAASAQALPARGRADPAQAPGAAAVPNTGPAWHAAGGGAQAGTDAADSADAADAADSQALQRRARAFIAAIAPSARAAAQALGVSPVGILAQAALETGWGRHAPGNNLFGIKAGTDWQGTSLRELSAEVSGGVRSLGEAAFRAYRSVAASVHDYASLLESPRYAGVRGHGEDLGAFARGLQQAGYATDPGYARKLLQVADSPTMRDALAASGLGAAGSSLALP